MLSLRHVIIPILLPSFYILPDLTTLGNDLLVNLFSLSPLPQYALQHAKKHDLSEQDIAYFIHCCVYT